MGKLSGVKVVDLTQFFPGPMMTVMMADHGADVVKIEPPSGDPVREMAPFEAGQSVWFRNLNRGKRCMRLDLKTAEGKAELEKLVADADVFVEGFRPGVARRLGFGPERLLELNPRIISCSISAFGQTGPLANHPAHDLAVEAFTGFLSVNDTTDGTPVVPGVPAADMAAGLTALSAVLMALLSRERTGKGDHVDISMFDSLLPWSVHINGDALMGGAAPRSTTQRSLGGSAFYQVYETADGRHVTLGGREEKFARALLTAFDRLDLLPSAMSAPGPTQNEAREFLAATFKTKTRDEWVEWMHGVDTAFAPVLDLGEAFASPNVTERRRVIVKDDAHHLAPAIHFAGDPEWTPPADPE